MTVLLFCFVVDEDKDDDHSDDDDYNDGDDGIEDGNDDEGE